MENYYIKYLKYKNKYLSLKQYGGTLYPHITISSYDKNISFNINNPSEYEKIHNLYQKIQLYRNIKDKKPYNYNISDWIKSHLNYYKINLEIEQTSNPEKSALLRKFIHPIENNFIITPDDFDMTIYFIENTLDDIIKKYEKKITVSDINLHYILPLLKKEPLIDISKVNKLPDFPRSLTIVDSLETLLSYTSPILESYLSGREDDIIKSLITIKQNLVNLGKSDDDDNIIYIYNSNYDNINEIITYIKDMIGKIEIHIIDRIVFDPYQLSTPSKNKKAGLLELDEKSFFYKLYHSFNMLPSMTDILDNIYNLMKFIDISIRNYFRETFDYNGTPVTVELGKINNKIIISRDIGGLIHYGYIMDWKEDSIDFNSLKMYAREYLTKNRDMLDYAIQKLIKTCTKKLIYINDPNCGNILWSFNTNTLTLVDITDTMFDKTETFIRGSNPTTIMDFNFCLH